MFQKLFFGITQNHMYISALSNVDSFLQNQNSVPYPTLLFLTKKPLSQLPKEHGYIPLKKKKEMQHILTFSLKRKTHWIWKYKTGIMYFMKKIKMSTFKKYNY